MNRPPVSEQETAITWMARDDIVTIFSSYAPDINKLDKLCIDFPSDYKMIKEEIVTGSKTYQVSRKCIKFGKPYKQVEGRGDNLKKMWEAKKKENEDNEN